jgi:hypothetical protein
MVVVALTVSKFFSLPDIIPNNWFAAKPSASGDAAENITGRSSPPIRSTGKSAGRVRRSGVRLTLDTGSNIARSILGKWNGIASGSTVATKSAAC